MKKAVFINGGGSRVAEIFQQYIPQGFQGVCISKEALDHEKAAALQDAEYLILHPAAIDDALLKNAGRLKHIQLLTAGYDKMNIPLCRELGISVATNGGANSWSVAEHSLAMLLAVYRRIVDGDRAVRAGAWRGPLPEFTTFELAGKTVGVLGAGNIGRKVAARYKAFETEILYYDIAASDYMEKELNARRASIEEIVREADILSIHLPLFDSTRGILGAAEFAAMKPDMVLVNTGRAELVDTKAMIGALQQKRILAAALDVFDEEPIAADSPLLRMEQVLLSPHIAGHSAEGWNRRLSFAWQNLQRVTEGQAALSLVRH